MRPCAWCVLQRLIYLGIGLTALVGAIARAPKLRGVIVLVLLALCASGVAAALWQHFVAASADSCDLTLAERIVSSLKLDEWLPDVFVAWASCKDAAVKVLGVAFELWSLLLYLMLAAATLAALAALRRV
jgi:protein dithiol:quinone oxidoreductase